MKILKNRSGFTLVEVIIATLILAIATFSLVEIQTFMSRQSVAIKEKTFANQKAMQLMEELRSLVAGAEKTDVSVLDDYDDGSQYSNILTTDKTVSRPEAPLSGNTAACGGWKYKRQISVVKLAEEPYARRVYVRLYRETCAGETDKLAEAMSVLKTIKSEYEPTQVMDVYIIAIENVPGWWSALSTMRPIFDSVMQDLQTRNPGLEIRAHWITRMAFGRDKLYRPYINSAAKTNAQAMPWIYFYPGRTEKSDGNDFFFYDPDLFQAKMNIDGEQTNASSYALADKFNHAVRYPEEVELYNSMVADAEAAGTTPPEISLRMLLEKLNSGDLPYKNILLINLHGELLPLPPMRNYSDAAKDPENHPDYRVVTHPQQLKYDYGDEVKLMVYPYMINPDSYASTLTLSSMTILMDSYVGSANISVDKIEGNGSVAYTRTTLAASSTDYAVTHPTAQSTLITLYGTPMRHPTNGNAGLDSSQRLYGLEYIPAPIHPSGAPDFTYDLTWNNKTKRKNTARWIITLAANSMATGMHTFSTRIGNDTATGTLTNEPANLSKTYTWVGVEPPVTEKYQFMGDPRDNPYKDVKADNGYNWYFTSVPSSEIQGYGKTASGWGPDYNDIDVPRFYQIYRQGLLNSQAIWSAMNGFSYYYFGMGGEFGSDMEPLPNALPFVKTPWSRTGETGTINVEEIIEAHGSATYGNARIIAKTDNSWYAKPWIGELYPDVYYSTWSATGNLPTGSGQFYRSSYNNSSLTTDWGARERRSRTNTYGCSSFFNGKPSSGNGPFKHVGSDSATGSITLLGSNMATLFNFPLLTSITAPRPFTLNYGSAFPSEWNDSTYSGMRTTLSIPSVGSTSRVYYDSSYNSSSYDASSVVKVSTSGSTAYFVVSGLATQSDFGTASMGKYVIISMMRAFMDAGLYTGQDKITQLPYVEITKPTVADEFNNPVSITVQWNTSWLRWDGQKYTDDYSSSYSDSSSIEYELKYSNDNGRTWKHCMDGTKAEAGVKNPLYVTTLSSYNWSVGALPKGSYILRVEAYRAGTNLHYSYDQFQLYLHK